MRKTIGELDSKSNVKLTFLNFFNKRMITRILNFKKGVSSMKVKSINFPTKWEENPSIDNQIIKVCVELEDGYKYVLMLATRKNIEYLMDQKNYFEPGMPVIMVKELTKEIIEETVQVYAKEEDGYWLKSCHFAGRIDTAIFDQLQAEHIKYQNEVFGSDDLDELNNS